MGANNSRVVPVSSAAGAVVEEVFEWDVFLGGTCGSTTWRKDVAIKRFAEVARNGRRIKAFNPQVDEWTPECAEIEKRAKNRSKVILMVLDNVTTAQASLAEACYYLGKGRKMVIMCADYEKGALGLSDDLVKDLNRGRVYLRQFADSEGVPICGTVGDAVDAVIEMLEA